MGLLALRVLLWGSLDGSYDFYRNCSRCGRRLNLSYLSRRQRLPAIVPDGFLLLLEDRWRRGWCHFCDYSASLHRGGRPGVNSNCSGSKDGLLRRYMCRGKCSYWRACDCVLIDVHGIFRHGLGRSKRLGCCGRNRSGYRLVDVLHIRHVHVLVYDRVVIIVVHHGGVYRGIRNVNVIHVIVTDGIRRNVDFARSQWKPRDASASAVSTADPGYQRRGVYGPNVLHSFCPRRCWHPAPRAIHTNPAAIVKRSKTPRLIIHPGITPRLDVSPMPVVVRSPVRPLRVRKPHVSVIGRWAPHAVVIKVFVTDHV